MNKKEKKIGSVLGKTVSESFKYIKISRGKGALYERCIEVKLNQRLRKLNTF